MFIYLHCTYSLVLCSHPSLPAAHMAATLACVQGKERMDAKAQKESIISIARSRSVGSTTSTGATTGTGGAATGGNVSFTERGSVGIIRLSSIANFVPGEANGKGLTVADCSSTESGSVGLVMLGSITETGPETTETATVAAADGTAMVATRAVADGRDVRGSVGTIKFGGFPKNVAESGVSTAEETGGATPGSENGNKNHTTAGKAGGVPVGKGGGTVQGGQARLVRRGSFVRRNTRLGRVDFKLRRAQRHRRKPHHYLMALTYSGLQPGMRYHIRVAGISSVGQVSRTMLGFFFVFVQERICRNGRGGGGPLTLDYGSRFFLVVSGAASVISLRQLDTCVTHYSFMGFGRR